MEALLRPLFCSTVTLPTHNNTTFRLQLLSQNPTLSSSHYCTTTANFFSFSTMLSTPFRFPPSVIYATPDSQLSVGINTETREWAMQDFYTLRRDVENSSEHVEEIRASAGLEQLERELAALEMKAADSSFWDDRSKAQETLLALTDVKDKIKLLTEFKTQVQI